MEGSSRPADLTECNHLRRTRLVLMDAKSLPGDSCRRRDPAAGPEALRFYRCNDLGQTLGKDLIEFHPVVEVG